MGLSEITLKGASTPMSNMKQQLPDRAVVPRRTFLKAAAAIAAGVSAGLPVGAAPAQTGERPAKKILVAYFSRTGSTRAVANQIRDAVGGELFELRTAHSYPAEYRATTEQAKRELNEDFRPVLTTRVADMAGYDVVFIGFPNWWGTLPTAFFSFLEQYPLSAKTVIPFCTHEGSRFGRSLDDLRSRCGDARILEGLALRGGGADRVAGESVRKEVARWLQGLGLEAGDAT
jgi:flavodoxin